MSMRSGQARRAECAVVAMGFLLCAATAAWGDVTILTAQTANMSCSGGVCAPTAASAVLNVTDLENMLASGAVEVTTTGSGVQADNIDVTGGLAWSNTSALALDAYKSVAVGAVISVTGAGGLSIHTGDGGKGAFKLGTGGEITFADLSSALVINRVSFTLENTIQSLAAAIANNSKGNYALASNYDASQDGIYAHPPIPTTFAGTFDGLGNSISNFSIADTTDEYVGLFAQVSELGVIRNVGLANSTVNLTGNTVSFESGTLAGVTGENLTCQCRWNAFGLWLVCGWAGRSQLRTNIRFVDECVREQSAVWKRRRICGSEYWQDQRFNRDRECGRRRSKRRWFCLFELRVHRTFVCHGHGEFHSCEIPC